MKNSKKILLVLAAFLMCHDNTAQSQKDIDSLIRVALSQKNTRHFNPDINRDSLLRAAYRAGTSKERIDLAYEISVGHGALGAAQVWDYYRRLLQYSQKTGDKALEAVMLSEIGYGVASDGDNAKGLALLEQALVIAKESGSDQALGVVYDNLGVCYPKSREISKKYFLKALHHSLKAKHHLFVAYEYVNLYSLYQDLKKQDSARYYSFKGLKYAIDNQQAEAIPKFVIDYSYSTADPGYYLKKALQLPYSKIDPSSRANIVIALAFHHKNKKDVDSAVYYIKEAIGLQPVLSYEQRASHAYGLSLLYRGINADSSYNYTDTYTVMRDSLYSGRNMQYAYSMKFAEEQQARELELNFRNNLKLYVLGGIGFIILIVSFLLWRNNKNQKKAFKALEMQKMETEEQKIVAENALTDLKQTQNQLVQSEKMASLGELTAGIAHEIQNPLNFVNNFSEVSMELLDEMGEELDKGDMEEAKAIAGDIKLNLEKINYHGKRADGIVKGMLQHSRASSGQKEPTDINELADEYLRLAYHGLRAKDKSFNADLVTDFDEGLPKVNVIPQDIGRVLLNLFTNAFYATNEKSKQVADGSYKPSVEVSTLHKGDAIVIIVKDNGTGIPDAIKDKILQPFFTTKPTGEGTGLGLSLSYDIVVKGHGGAIDIRSIEGQETEFTVKLPVSN